MEAPKWTLKEARSSSPAGPRAWAPGTARMVVEGGGNALIADLKEAEGQALVAELGKAARFVKTDVADEASARGAVAAAVSTFGGLRASSVAPASCMAKRSSAGTRPMRSRHSRARFRSISSGMFDADPARGGRDEQRRAERRRRARRHREHGVSRRVRREDPPRRTYAASKGGVVAMTLPIARELARFGYPHHDDVRYLRNAVMASTCAPKCRRRWAGGPFPQRMGKAQESGIARRRDHPQPDAQRRSDPARRRDPDGAEVTSGVSRGGRAQSTPRSSR